MLEVDADDMRRLAELPSLVPKGYGLEELGEIVLWGNYGIECRPVSGRHVLFEFEI